MTESRYLLIQQDGDTKRATLYPGPDANEAETLPVIVQEALNREADQSELWDWPIITTLLILVSIQAFVLFYVICAFGASFVPFVPFAN